MTTRIARTTLLVLGLAGCGEPFTLLKECNPPPTEKDRIIITGPVEYPTGTVVGEPPLPPRSTRPGPDGKVDAGDEEPDASDLDGALADAMDVDASDADAGADDAAPFAPEEGDAIEEEPLR